MTEDEAKTKWCPFVRITPETDGYNPLTNRNVGVSDDDTDISKEVCCVGSRCMAWRWSPAGEASPADPHSIIGRAIHATSPYHTPDGYCGLVEKP